jgi:hypothetical protein
MRTLLLATALAAALTLGGAAGADAQGPAQDSVTGRAATCPSVDLDPESCLRAGPLPLPYIGLAADAVSGSSGQDPAGTMSWFEYPGGSMLFSGETQVTCLSVTGNVAIIGVAGTLHFVSAFGGSFTRPTAGLIRVTDGGGPASGLDSFEFETNLLRPPAGPLPDPTDCSSFPEGLDVRHNVGGDLVVHDAPPLPTSKDQCKNGGWRNFAGFTNQGGCVSFVATGGRHPPGS